MKLDSTLNLKQVLQVQPQETQNDGNRDPTIAIRSMIDEYVIDKMVNYNVVYGETLCLVRWYGYDARDDTVKPAETYLIDSLNSLGISEIVGNAYMDHKLGDLIK